MAEKTDRRCFLARGVLGAVGAGAAYSSIEEHILQAAVNDGTAQPGPGKGEKPKVDIAPGSLPHGKIGNVSLSRLLVGGNLIGGFAHARDLMYASKLFTSYNTEAKIFETLELCQACGINAMQSNPACLPLIAKYNKSHSEQLQLMVCISFYEDKLKTAETIKRQIDLGAKLLYSHGGVTDSFMKNGGKMDVIAQMVELIKAQGAAAGVGGHSLNMPMACEEHKVNPDFYVKTFHMDRYWSATPTDHRHEYDFLKQDATDHNANFDNMWCNNPEETAAFMEKVEKPWVAFKVMAAGAIPPRPAFSHAYRNGADFIIAGMFDFQVESDVKIAIENVNKFAVRKRPWRA